MTFIDVKDIVESNGKTIGENNASVHQKYPIGTLVEVKFDRWYGEGACEKIHARLFVVAHTRDCDHTPMYTLSPTALSMWLPRSVAWFATGQISSVAPPFTPTLYSGFVEEALTPIEVTEAVRRGYGHLNWKEEE